MTEEATNQNGRKIIEAEKGSDSLTLGELSVKLNDEWKWFITRRDQLVLRDTPYIAKTMRHLQALLTLVRDSSKHQITIAQGNIEACKNGETVTTFIIKRVEPPSENTQTVRVKLNDQCFWIGKQLVGKAREPYSHFFAEIEALLYPFLKPPPL